MSTRENYCITLHRPEGVTVQEMVLYIREAVEDWGGQRRNDDPLFYAWNIKGHKTNGLPRIQIKRL